MKIKQAAALRYNPDNNLAPEIVAKGKGLIAEKIVEKAKESNVPIYYDEKLAETLNAMNLGEEIPPQLYRVVAEILVFVSDLDKKYGERYGIYRKDE
ncbi:MAG: EscU/YscU/HrcU family type III secretion system export apparatus switch protein [Firmicutes bacterium]|nr:EscU/YscU/HrcU family type III secretion system export apparatus switch protein [Bacillota bacterium]